jgi:5'-AMP-activated protein kinase regulatory beta subunit
MGGSISKSPSAKLDPGNADAVGARARAPAEAADAAMSDGDASGSGAEAASSSRLIPAVFRWEHGGTNVYITGSFNAWGRRIPMHRSGNDFIHIQSLTAGRHAYKFVVDDEWRFAPDQPTVSDTTGNMNNVIDLTDFDFGDAAEEDCVPWMTGTAAAAAIRRRDSLTDTRPYGHELPDEETFSKEPPQLPPQLRNLILNSPSPESTDSTQLPAPMHVSVNHLFWCVSRTCWWRRSRAGEGN